MSLTAPQERALNWEIWGTRLQSWGDFTGWKGVAKFGGVFGILQAVHFSGYTISNEDIAETFNEVPVFGPPLGVFVEHVNALTFEGMAIEATAIYLIARALRFAGGKCIEHSKNI